MSSNLLSDKTVDMPFIKDLATKWALAFGVLGFLLGFQIWSLFLCLSGMWYGNVYSALQTGEINPHSRAGGHFYNKTNIIKRSENSGKFFLNVFVEVILASITLVVVIDKSQIFVSN